MYVSRLRAWFWLYIPGALLRCGYPAFLSAACCFALCMGQGLPPSNWLDMGGSCLPPGGTLATREQTSPRWRGGSGALAFPPSVAWSYGPPHRPNGTQPGACCHPTFLNCLKKMVGTVSWYMLPTKSSTSHLASTKVLHGHSPFHAPNRQGRPSGLKHQEGLVSPSSPRDRG